MSWKCWLPSCKYRSLFRCVPFVCYASTIAFLLQNITSSCDGEKDSVLLSNFLPSINELV